MQLKTKHTSHNQTVTAVFRVIDSDGCRPSKMTERYRERIVVYRFNDFLHFTLFSLAKRDPLTLRLDVGFVMGDAKLAKVDAVESRCDAL